eukprot:6149319-Alexandrium_andersonii.AAC.1
MDSLLPLGISPSSKSPSSSLAGRMAPLPQGCSSTFHFRGGASGRAALPSSKRTREASLDLLSRSQG